MEKNGQMNIAHSGSEGLVSLPAEKLLPILTEAVNCGGRFVITVTGNSMTPTLHHLKDRVELVSVDQRPVRKGEIILFQRATGECILHRVLREENQLYRVNGDAQTWVEWVSPKRVLAVVSRVQRGGKWISCDGKRYRAYVWLWSRIIPFRPYVFKTVRFFRSLFKGKWQ